MHEKASPETSSSNKERPVPLMRHTTSKDLDYDAGSSDLDPSSGSEKHTFNQLPKRMNEMSLSDDKVIDNFFVIHPINTYF